MRVVDFSFELPEQLIARYPTSERTASRLMTLDGNSGGINHLAFPDILPSAYLRFLPKRSGIKSLKYKLFLESPSA